MIIRSLAGLMLLFATTAAMAQEQDSEAVNNCVACHGVLGDDRLSAPVGSFPQDIHSLRGLDCVSCHGGDAEAPGMSGMDRALGFLGKPDRQEIPEFCGRCHADGSFMRRYNPSLRVDQVAEYATSVHGRRLMEMGDTLVATCLSCHPAHNIKPPSDPTSSVHPMNVEATCAACHGDAEYMSAYPIDTDQREEYQQSVHAEMLHDQNDLSAPTCNDCHGTHGAAPPGISWVGNVCGQCHSVMAEFYAQSRHAQTFTMLGMPGCATCHQNHHIVRASDEMLGLGEQAICAGCHVADDAGGQTASAMRALIDSLRGQYEHADDVIRRVENAGVEASQPRFELNSANAALISARAAMHSFDLVRVREAVEEGLAVTAEVLDHGDDALRELRFRRVGLAIAVTIILVLIVGLVLKIRELEGARAVTQPQESHGP